MLQKLNRHGKLEFTLLLAAFSLFCLLLSLTRWYITGSKMYLFLNWNLFLAFLPWALSTLLWLYPTLKQKTGVTALFLGTWILFFPNAPYILTDLYHLRIKTAIPIWFDVVLILSFAWTGLLYGFTSLLDVESSMAERFGKKAAGICVFGLLFLGSFGIYLGRFLRWNSWDILREPLALLSDIASRFTDPVSHPRTWAVTVLMGLLLNGMYWSMKYLRQNTGTVSLPSHASKAVPERNLL